MVINTSLPQTARIDITVITAVQTAINPRCLFAPRNIPNTPIKVGTRINNDHRKSFFYKKNSGGALTLLVSIGEKKSLNRNNILV